MSPKTIFALPFSITHKGEYSTTYHLKAEYPSDLVVQLSDQYLTLQPNEVKTCELVVLSPERFYEPGANYPVTVTAVSEDGSAIHSAEFMVISQGFYLSQLLVVFILAATLLALILIFIIQKLRGKISKLRHIDDEQRRKNVIDNIKNKRKNNQIRRKTKSEYHLTKDNFLKNNVSKRIRLQQKKK